MKSTSICLHDKEVKCFNDDNIFLSVLSWVITKNQSKCVFNSAYYRNTVGKKINVDYDVIQFLGSHDLLYQEFLPLLPNLLQGQFIW